MVSQPGLRLGLGDSVNYTGDADLVFSHLYGPLPKQLIGKPAIVNLYGNKKSRAEEWVGCELHEVGKWAKGTNTIYVANLPPTEVIIEDLVEDEFAPGRGWFPEELVRRLMQEGFCRGEHETIFDGFMGRGTVGRWCMTWGKTFVGIDRDPARVQTAREYLGC